MYNATSLIDKLMEYYGVNTISVLSDPKLPNNKWAPTAKSESVALRT